MVNALIMMVVQSRWCPDVNSIDHVSNDGERTDNDGYIVYGDLDMSVIDQDSNNGETTD